MSRASGALSVENLPGELREQGVKGHKIEKSVNEVGALLSGTETPCFLVVNENKFPVSSVNGLVPETKEIIEHKDGNEKSLELQQSSEITDSLTPVAESGIAQRPVESDGAVLEIARDHDTEYVASALIENVAANNHEMIIPETGNAENGAIECVEDAFDLTAEHGTERVPSCLTGNDAVTAEDTEQKTEVESFDVALSSPVSCSKLKPVAEDANDTTIVGGGSTSLTGKVISRMDCDLETPGPQSSESTDHLMLAADSSIIQGPVEIDENVLDIVRKHEPEYEASPSVEKVAANAHEVIKPESGNADNIAVECGEDALDLNTELGTERVPSCLIGNDAATAKVIGQETTVESSEGAVSSTVSCSRNDITTVGADSTSCLTDKVSFTMEFDLATSGPQSSESTDSWTLTADSNIVQSPVESDENVLDIAREQEAEYEASPSVEKVAANTQETIKPNFGKADNVAIECAEDALELTVEPGTELVPSCLTGNDAATGKEIIEQEPEVEIFEGAVSSPVSCCEMKPIIEDVNDTTIAGCDSTKCSMDKVITSMEFDLGTPGPQDASTLQGHDDLLNPEISIMDDVCSDARYVPCGEEEEFEVGGCSVIGSRDMPCNDVSGSFVTNDKLPNCALDSVDMESSEVGSCSVISRDMPCNGVSSGNDVSDSFLGNDKLPNCALNNVDVECKGEDLTGAHVNCDDKLIHKDMPCNDVSSRNDFSDNVAKDKLPSCVLDNVDTESKGEHLAGPHVNSDDKLVCQENKDVENSLKIGKSMSLPENSSAGPVAVQDVVEPLTRTFRFLIKMPRFEDFKLKEQIRKAQLVVEEKTQHRDAFRIEVQKYKANCLGYAAEYDAAISESRTLKRSVKAKRAEIDSLQSVINKVKNAISVEDIDARIHGMEHVIQHETLPLKEEKLLIREMKQLKQLREQLSSNIGSHDEVQQALNNRDQIEEHLKFLKKELESLKDSVLRADAVVRTLEKKYEDENKKVKEVQTQYAAANNVRQDAYAHLQSLRKQLFEKNQQFRMYKDNAAAASNYAAKRDTEALHHLCVNQVESIMKLWNQNNEFREEYVRCNMKSTLRRLGTIDGRSLGPDEQPHVLTSYGDERVDRLASNPVISVPILQTQNLEQDLVEPVESVRVDDKIKVMQPEQNIPATRPRKQEDHVFRNDLATGSGREITNNGITEEWRVPIEEELELARKVEEKRIEEAEAKLKEQRRLEERAKALEALERKKRNAEKAQMRAELKAQKEAEQREKEREKRLRKKERRKGSASDVSDGNNLVETTSNCESLMETTKEPETKENHVAVSKKPQKMSLFTKQSKSKSIPPPLRNRGRRKIQQWMWVILTCLLVIALFLLGNVGFFSNLSNLRRRNSGF